MDTDDLDRELVELQTGVTRARANLLALETDPTRELLDTVELEGVTADRWAQARSTLAWLFVSAASLASVIDEASALRRSWTTPPATRAQRLRSLLHAESIVVTDEPVPAHDRDLLADSHVLTRCTPRELLERMAEAHRDVASVVAAAAAVWSSMPSRVREARDALAVVRALAAGIDDPSVAAVRETPSRLDDVARRVLVDPLSVGQDELDAIDEVVATVAARVRHVAAVRDDADGALAAARRRLAEVRDEVEAATAARAHAALRFVDRDLPPPVDVPALVGSGVDEAAVLAGAADWHRLAAALDAAHAELDEVSTRARAVAAGCTDLLRSRDELRGRLRGYQAMAGDVGCVEDAEVTEMHDAARTALYTAPTDLAQAAALVAEYQAVVRRAGACRSRP